MAESIDESALTVVDKLLKARKIANPLWVGWVDKVNQVRFAVAGPTRHVVGSLTVLYLYVFEPFVCVCVCLCVRACSETRRF